MTRDSLSALLLAPSIMGARATFYTAVAIGVPTAIRVAVDGFVSGCELTIYLPFVLISAVFMGSRHAAATALISVALAETVIMGPHHSIFGSACSVYSISVFFIGSAVLIAFVQGLRRLIALRLERLGSSERGIVFSSEDGQARASWYGQLSSVQLGPQEEVAEMMKDFLTQLELGKRLTQPKN